MASPRRALPPCIPSSDTFRFLDGLLSWLEQHALTIADAEATILHACQLAPGGLAPDQITSYFLEAHNMPKDDAELVTSLASLMLYRGRLQRLHGGRYIANAKKTGPHVFALVKIPVEEWDAFRLHNSVHLGRAAWVAGDDDRA